MEELERTSEDQAGEEGLHNLNLAQSCAPDTKRTLLKQSRQRSIGRTRLHLALSSLKGQPTERNTLQQGQDVVTVTSNSKTSRKVVPTKMTSDAVKEFYNFSLSIRKTKGRKQKPSLQNLAGTVDSAMDQSSSVTTVSSADCRNEPPAAGITPTSQMQGPVLLNVDSQGNPTQIPFITPHVLPLAGGGQPALVFFVGTPGMPATGDLQSVSNMGSSAPFGNAMFFTQPLALNVVPQDASSTSGGVIEKAMELAQFQTNPVQSDNQVLSQNTTELAVSSGGFIPASASCTLQSSASQAALTIDASFSSLPQVSQNVVVTQSVAAGENVPIDNVSQSVTVQTSQIVQNQGFADFRAFLEEAQAEFANSSVVRAETNQYDTPAGPKLIYKRKGLRIREVMTQTGADPEILIISERKLDGEEDSSLVEETVENSNTNRTTKKPVSARVRRFGCDKCEKKFYTNNDLRRHQTSHQESRPFTCEECQKGFRTASELTLHKAIHVEVKQYKCEFCGKEFRTKGCIKSHIKYHIGDKRHKCTECDRAFVKSADLKRHMAGHRNEKKFVCDDCGSAFTRRDNLKAHRLLHTRESVVTCDLCSKEFINAVYLKRHMHIHKQAKKKPYECQWCPKTYEQLEGLRRHIRQHVGDEKFVCKDCGKKFITSIQLKRHLWLSHDQDSPYRRSIL